MIVRQSRRKQIPERCNLNNPSLGYILGCLYGDGSIGKRNIELSVKDLDFVKRFKYELLKLGFETSPIKIHNNGNKTPLHRCILSSTNFIEFIKKININKLSSESKKKFILGMFDSDGCASLSISYKINKTTNKKYPYYSRFLEFWNTDMELLIYIKSFLEEFDIESVLGKKIQREHIVNGKRCIPTKKYIYRLRITGKKDFVNFNKLGNLMKRKHDKLDKILYSYDYKEWN